MTRPCYLVVDREYSGSISTRKLVIETAKFNVITVYSGGEALETLRKFSNVDGIVLDAGMPDMPCSELIASLRTIKQSVPIILVGRPGHEPCEGSDHYLYTFQPVELLSLLQKLQPEQTAALEKRIEELHAEGA